MLRQTPRHLRMYHQCPGHESIIQTSRRKSVKIGRRQKEAEFTEINDAWIWACAKAGFSLLKRRLQRILSPSRPFNPPNMKPVTFLRNAWRRKERKTESRRDGSIGTAEGPEFSTPHLPFSTQSELPVITLAMNNPTLQKDLSTSIEEAWLRRSVYGISTLKTDDLENEGRSDHPFAQTGHYESPLNARYNGNRLPLNDTCGQRNVVRGPPIVTKNSVPTSLTGQNSLGYPTRKTNSSPQRQRAGSATVPARSPTCVTFAVASAAPRPSSLRSALPNFRKDGDLGKVSKSQGAIVRDIPRYELQREPFSAPPFMTCFQLVDDVQPVIYRPKVDTTTSLNEKVSRRTVDAILDLSSFSKPRSLYAATGSTPYLPFVEACSSNPELHLGDRARSHADVDSFPLSLFPTPPPLVVRRKKRVPKPLILHPSSVPHCTSIQFSPSPGGSSIDSTPLATPASPQSLLPPLSPSSSSPISLGKRTYARSASSILPPQYAPPDSPLPMPPTSPKRGPATIDSSRSLRVARSSDILRQPPVPFPASHRLSFSEPISELDHNTLNLTKPTSLASRTYSESAERRRSSLGAQVQWGYAL